MNKNHIFGAMALCAAVFLSGCSGKNSAPDEFAYQAPQTTVSQLCGVQCDTTWNTCLKNTYRSATHTTEEAYQDALKRYGGACIENYRQCTTRCGGSFQELTLP